jgi:CubicO group peptidase (beta-lactamase class C family)
MKYKILLLPFVVLVALSCVKHTDTEVTSSSVNMVEDRLARIDTLLNNAIEQNQITGAVAYIARDGKIAYYRAFGMDDKDKQKPLKKDAIFRIASQTKAITSVAVMILIEEGKLLLDDPISKYIPEFANPKVLDKFNEKDSSYTTTAAKREITIRDLLTHTSGIDYAGIGNPVMQALYAKYQIPVGFESKPLVLGNEMKKLGALPLYHQPGERFTYGLNCDVLGYLVEVISGKSFKDFLSERIFKPLGMEDTYFYIPAEKRERLVMVHTENEKGESQPWKDNIIPGLNVNYPLTEGTYFSGGAGLSSTISDYGKFLQMMLDGGVYNGNRILSERTIELMTCNQIGDLSIGKDKFGLGFLITTEDGQARLGVTQGSFSWGGYFSTTYWADPEKNMVCEIFMQQVPMSHSDIEDKFRVLVYSALE